VGGERESQTSKGLCGRNEGVRRRGDLCERMDKEREGDSTGGLLFTRGRREKKGWGVLEKVREKFQHEGERLLDY